MNETKLFWAMLVLIAVTLVGGIMIGLQGCSHAPRMAERVKIMQACGYPTNPHEAKVFHGCIVDRSQNIGDDADL